MKKLLMFSMLVLGAAATAFGDLPTAQFLLVGQGARSAAMGDAVVSNCFDYSSMYWNPAASVFMANPSSGLGGAQLPAGISSGYLSFAGPVNPNKTVGFGMNLIYEGANVPSYDIAGNKLADLNTFDFAYQFALAFKLGEHFSFAPEIGFVAMDLDNYFSDPAFNLGLSTLYKNDRFSAGLVFANMGGRLQFTDEKGNTIGDPQSQPQLMRYGASYSLLKNRNLLISYSHQDVNDDSAASWSSFGAELYLSRVIALRAGTRSGSDGSTVQSFGFGLNFPRIVLEFAQTMSPSALDGMNTSTFDLQFKFNSPSARAYTAESTPPKEEEGRIFKRAAAQPLDQQQPLVAAAPVTPVAPVPVAAPAVPAPVETAIQPVPEADRLTVAVQELTGKGVSAMDASVVSDFLRDALTNTKTYNLVERSSMEQLLSEQKFQMSGCTSDECAVKMGKILNVQRMILGSFSKLGDVYYISVRMVDVEKGTIMSAETVNAADMKDILSRCVELSNRLSKNPGKKSDTLPASQNPQPTNTQSAPAQSK